MQRRTPARAPLSASRYDIAIIGGGINGVAIARECARHRKRVLLLERNDFASGTTSRSTRIIHGGLRYLEHGELSLVRESLRERELLLRERPHLVRPLRFILALGAGRRHSALEIRTGLWLYRKLAGAPVSITTPGEDMRALEAALDKGQRWSIFDYEDAQCEFPERLVAEWLVDAAADGTEIRNHCEVLGIAIRDGRVKSLIVRDLLDETESTIETEYVINATGPWADDTFRLAGIPSTEPMVGGVRGSHLVTKRFPGAPDAALYSEARDGRPIFVIPWNGQILIGTTEEPDRDNPSTTAPTLDEIEYLLASVNQLFPQAGLAMDDVRYAFAGVRPLTYVEGVQPSAVTRKHLIHDHRDDGAEGLISIIGGKLTTASALARDVARHIGIDAQIPRAILAAIGDSNGVETTIAEWARTVAGAAGISQASACALAKMRGRRALCVAQLAKVDARLRETLCPHTDHIVAEAIDAVRFEYAVTLGDILLRRVPVALSACWDEECARHASEKIGAVLGWDSSRIGFELQEFMIERGAFLKRPTRDPLRRHSRLPVESVA